MFIDTARPGLDVPVTLVCHRLPGLTGKNPSIREAETAVGKEGAQRHQSLESATALRPAVCRQSGREPMCLGDMTQIVGRISDRLETTHWLPHLLAALRFFEQAWDEVEASL